MTKEQFLIGFEEHKKEIDLNCALSYEAMQERFNQSDNQRVAEMINDRRNTLDELMNRGRD